MNTWYYPRQQETQGWGRPEQGTSELNLAAGERTEQVCSRVRSQVRKSSQPPGTTIPPIPAPHLFLKALFTMALSTRRSPTWDGPRK